MLSTCTVAAFHGNGQGLTDVLYLGMRLDMDSKPLPHHEKPFEIMAEPFQNHFPCIPDLSQVDANTVARPCPTVPQKVGQNHFPSISWRPSVFQDEFLTIAIRSGKRAAVGTCLLEALGTRCQRKDIHIYIYTHQHSN